MYLQRIFNLKKNFGNCEAGRQFLLKTGPIWDSLTQCIYRKSRTLKEMDRNSYDKNMPAEYRRIYEQTGNDEAAYENTRDTHGIDTSFLQSLVGGK